MTKYVTNYGPKGVLDSVHGLKGQYTCVSSPCLGIPGNVTVGLVFRNSPSLGG